MSFGFGKESAEVRKAKDQRKIDKMKLKTERERMKIKEKEAKIKIREKSGGFGGTITLHDKAKMPTTSGKGGKRRK